MRETTKLRFGFYGQRQAYAFMLWREYIYDGEVYYGRVIFAVLNVLELKQRHRKYLEWADRPHTFHPGARRAGPIVNKFFNTIYGDKS